MSFGGAVAITAPFLFRLRRRPAGLPRVCGAKFEIRPVAGCSLSLKE